MPAKMAANGIQIHARTTREVPWNQSCSSLERRTALGHSSI